MTSTQDVLKYDPNAQFEVESFDLEYRRDGDKAWLARVMRPRGTGPFPTVLDVHGGAWANGDRLMNEGSDLAMAASGLVVVAVDFRTSLDAPHPAALEDINYATRWLKTQAAGFGGSPDWLGGVGWSSGGHQLMLAAMRPEKYSTLPFGEAPSTDASFAYVILGWPVLDPLSRYRMGQERGNQQWIETTLAYFGDEADMTEASPPHILERGEDVELPPALILQGAADDALERMLAERFVEAYSLAGGVIELAKYPGAPHGFLREPGPNADRGLAMLKMFIARQIRAYP